MQGSNFQKVFAYAALFLLPFPALNFGVSFSVGDVFLLLAIAMNGSELTRIHTFQIPFLLAVPFFLVSALMDADGDLISVAQIVYIWGVVLPFGWTAFTNLTVPRIAQVLLLSAAVNAAVAVGQSTLMLPMLSDQKTIVIGREIARAAGLSNACNSLVMGLTPCFLLLPYLRSAHLRVLVLLVLVAGLLASVSKSILLAAPGLCFYFWRDGEKKRIVPVLLLATLFGSMAIDHLWGLDEIWDKMNQTADSRIQHTDTSIDTRWELVEIALDYAGECYLFGYGTEGTLQRIGDATDSTVHVYYLGLVVIAGVPAAILLTLGMLLLAKDVWQAGEVNIAVFLAVHMAACLVMTVLLLSFQSLPFMVAGAVLVRKTRPAAVTDRLPLRDWQAGQFC